jgi:PTS system N-acetylglucosamine-specific IIA component
VFSAGLVGPGTAIEPEDDGEVVAPIAGRIIKMHPHAFVVQDDDGHAVLVHLGINTVQLAGEGFTLHVAEGDIVAPGDLLVSWDPAAVRDGGRPAVCPVVALEASPDAVTTLAEPGTRVERGAELLAWS